MSTSDPGVRTFASHEDSPEQRETAARPTVSSSPRAAQPPGQGVVAGRPPAEPPAVQGERAPRPSSARPTGAQPAMRPDAAPARPAPVRPPGNAAGTRRARLTVARLDPWGVFKMSFLLSVALGVVYVVAAAVVWQILEGMGVFSTINDVLLDFQNEGSSFNVYDYVGRSNILSLATVIAVANVVILTLLSTLFAVLYNLGTQLVGGPRVTLTDE